MVLVQKLLYGVQTKTCMHKMMVMLKSLVLDGKRSNENCSGDEDVAGKGGLSVVQQQMG